MTVGDGRWSIAIVLAVTAIVVAPTVPVALVALVVVTAAAWRLIREAGRP